MMNKLFFVIFAITLFSVSCKKDDPLDVVEPKAYLPAYPGSYWDYSNGERVAVHTQYVAHSYQESINSTVSTPEKLVPQIGNQYLYEYSITQNSTTFPLKTLLSETVSSNWEVNEIQGEKIYRKTVESISSMYLKLPNKDSVLYSNVLVVVEYTDSLGSEKWNYKEYYAKDVGLIQLEVNNPYDNNAPVIEKQLISYSIRR
jgi:hypothetical protein